MSYTRIILSKLGILAVAFISTVFFAGTTFALAGIDTILQRVGESIRPKDTFEGMKKGFSFGDIYSSSYKLAQKEFLGTTAQALSDMTQELNMTYSCDLSVSDSTNILLTVDSARNDILAMVSAVQQELEDNSSESLVTSCTKLINCATKGNIDKGNLYDYDKQQKQSYLSNEGFVNCKNYATTAYQRNISTIETTITLAATNAQSEIYANGTLDDSPYDLLIDIQNIGDILFANNEQTEKTLFYTFPKNSVAGFQAIPFGGAGNDNYTPFPNSIQLGGNGNNNTNTAGGQNPTNNPTPKTTTNTPTGTTTQQGATAGATNPITGNPTNTPTNTQATDPIYVNTTNTNVDQGLIDNFACLPGTSPTGTNNGGVVTTPSNTTPINNGLGGDNIFVNPNITNTSPTASANNPGSTPPPTFNLNTPYYSPVVTSDIDPINTEGDFNDPSDYEKNEKNIKACTSKCDSLPAADKAMCIAKCMCGTTTTKDGMFSLSICTVPTKQTDIVSSKPVKSIEEIVTEINNVLNNLKNSGEMIKHTRTKEFLDTGLSKIKLNKIFAFEVNIAFKPILDTKPRRIEDADAENEKDQLLKGNYGSIDIQDEKNKYAALWNQCKEEKRLSEGQTLKEIQATLGNAEAACSYKYNIIAPKVSEGLAQAQNAAVADIIKEFLDQNARFRTYVNDSLANVQKTAEAFKQKIEKGK